MIAYGLIVTMLAFAVTADKTYECQHCAPCTKGDNPLFYKNCKFCILDETFHEGELTAVHRICGDQCEEHDKINGNGIRRSCCQEDRCNAEKDTRVNCHHCAPCDGLEEFPIHPNCKYCVKEETYSGGEITSTSRTCGDQCQPHLSVDGEGIDRKCCQNDLCNE